jgi:Lon-like protease
VVMSDGSVGRQSPEPMVNNHLSPQLRTALVSGIMAVVLLAALFTIRVPYVIFTPGPATNVLGKVGDKPLISITGRPSYPHAGTGTLDMTTIEVFGGPGSRVTLFGALRSWVSPEEAVVPEELVYPPTQTAAQVASETSQEMVDSQSSASAAGLREAGVKVAEKVSLVSVKPTAPAAAVLKPGDVVLAIDRRPVTDSKQLRTLVSGRAVGAPIEVTVRRSDKEVTVKTVTTPVEGRSGLGVTLQPGFVFPAQVRYASQDVGGPSAGMMFALGIYDLLTPGELTGGQPIAGTGTIDGDGLVGPIGGIAQKLVGAQQAGARWFIAPADNCTEVVGHVPAGLRVVRSATLHESRLAVEAIAAGRGESLPSC